LRSHLLYKFPTAFVFFCLSFCASAQKNITPAFSPPYPVPGDKVYYDSIPKLRLRNIFINGNKKTKDYIILREMELKPGDSIPIIYFLDMMEKDRQHIYNTTLFAEVTIEPLLINAFDFDIYIKVKERWFIYPLPELKFVDGNLNKWLMHYKGDLNKVNYGIKFIHYNLTGRKDQLALHLLNGYTKIISVNYKAPYANPDLTNGFSVGASFVESREIAYRSSYDNELVFYKKNDFVKTGWDINLGYSIRKGLKLSHFFNASYTHLRVDDSVITPKYNQSYFNKPVAKAEFVDLMYKLRYVDLNNVLYPLKGISASLSFGKRGLGLTGGINSFYIVAEYKS
jgi:outer membrane protein assembly factor BamA